MPKIYKKNKIISETNDSWYGTHEEYELQKSNIPFGTKIVFTDTENKSISFKPINDEDPISPIATIADLGDIQTALEVILNG